jgi:hypothetical protein
MADDSEPRYAIWMVLPPARSAMAVTLPGLGGAGRRSRGGPDDRGQEPAEGSAGEQDHPRASGPSGGGVRASALAGAS